MSRKELTMDRISEIKRQLSIGLPIIQISQNLKCSERTVRFVRDGKISIPGAHHRVLFAPDWCQQMNWDELLKEALAGHPFSLIWEERAQNLVGYKAFLDQFHKRFPTYKKTFVVHRSFAPGERCEVDYAGDKVEWLDTQTGEVFEAVVFVGILGFSQKIYAEATENQQGLHFVQSHVRMYNFFGGVPRLTVPDCLKQGVTRCHRYDPEINRSYGAMAKAMGTVIVPARPRRPKDKALVEGAVRIVMRYFRWKYRRHTFTSLSEINESLLATCLEINNRPHTKFKVSRESSWQVHERSSLQALPERSYECAEYKLAKVYDDSHVSHNWSHYSVPHQYRGMQVELRITSKNIEIYFAGDRLALHRRSHRHGEYVTDTSHLPENARAYHETTPQNLLSQAKFINEDLYSMIEELFQTNALGNLRRAQGFIRTARDEFRKSKSEVASQNISSAVKSMRMFNRVYVPVFKELLNLKRSQAENMKTDSLKINRQLNDNIRYGNNKPQ